MSEKIVVMAGLERKISFIRGKKVMVDFILADLYGVEPRQLKRAVRRNPSRFPKDFMFELTREEYRLLRCHFGTLEKGQHAKYLPYAFTEQGVAMLSSVLNSERAIQVNIQIMRAFVRLKETFHAQKKLAKKLQELEQKIGKHDEDIQLIFKAIQALIEQPPESSKKRIGFHADD